MWNDRSNVLERDYIHRQSMIRADSSIMTPMSRIDNQLLSDRLATINNSRQDMASGKIQMGNLFSNHPPGGQVRQNWTANESSVRQAQIIDPVAGRQYGTYRDVMGNSEYWKKLYTTDNARLANTIKQTGNPMSYETRMIGKFATEGLGGDMSAVKFEFNHHLGTHTPSSQIGSFGQAHLRNRLTEEYM